MSRVESAFILWCKYIGKDPNSSIAKKYYIVFHSGFSYGAYDGLSFVGSREYMQKQFNQHEKALNILEYVSKSLLDDCVLEPDCVFTKETGPLIQDALRLLRGEDEKTND